MALDCGPFGEEIHYWSQTGSTNDHARQHAEQGTSHGTLFITDEQVAGRGRRGRVWQAPAGSSLLMTILFRPVNLPAEHSYRLVMVCGLAVCDGIKAVSGIKAGIKWPNDVQIGEKKLAGLLPEGAIHDSNLEWGIVGMGINVNLAFAGDDPLAETATSVQIEAGRAIERTSLLAHILSRVNHWYDKIGTADLLTTWQATCVTLGRHITVTTPDGTLSGTAESIDGSGALLVRMPNHTVRAVTMSESVRVRRGLSFSQK